MIVYNITTKLSHAIATDWLQWQKDTHIPEIMETGLFTDYKLSVLLEHDEDEEGKTFVLQFMTPGMENYQKYLQEYATKFRQKAFDKWGNQFISFRSLLEVIH